jgi:hypothetical protein
LPGTQEKVASNPSAQQFRDRLCFRSLIQRVIDHDVEGSPLQRFIQLPTLGTISLKSFYSRGEFVERASTIEHRYAMSDADECVSEKVTEIACTANDQDIHLHTARNESRYHSFPTISQ